MKPVLFVLLGMSLSVFGVTKDDPSITVTGEAAVRVPADRAYLVFNTLEDDNIAKSAIEQAFQDMDRVIDTIHRRNKNGIQSVKLDSAIEQATNGEFVGSLSVRVSCAPKDEVIFELIDDACTVYATLTPHPGLANVLPFRPILYAVEDYEKAEDEVEDLAVADAKARAARLARKAGKQLGEIISIETDLIPAAARGIDLPTPYVSDNRTGVMMHCTVTITWQIVSEWDRDVKTDEIPEP